MLQRLVHCWFSELHVVAAAAAAAGTALAGVSAA